MNSNNLFEIQILIFMTIKTLEFSNLCNSGFSVDVESNIALENILFPTNGELDEKDIKNKIFSGLYFNYCETMQGIVKF